MVYNHIPRPNLFKYTYWKKNLKNAEIIIYINMFYPHNDMHDTMNP